jgi:signal transduction histidine kinase
MDLQERRQVNRLEEARLRTVVERIADGILVVNEDGAIKFANPAAEQLFGRSANNLAEAALGFPVVSGDKAEVQLLRNDGSLITAELRVADTDWAGEKAKLVSLRDVSDRKRAEAQSAQLERERLARAKAEAANEAKSEFLALMSHELRTPLNAVIGYADLLDLGIGGTLAPVHQQHIARIRQSGRHLLGLVDEILDLAKVESGKLTVRGGTGDAESTIADAIALVRPVAEKQGVAFATRPPAEDRTLYEGDPDRVRQILVNLLGNAVKFTDPDGCITIAWGTSSRRDEDARVAGSGPWFYLRVTDTGIGMAPETLEKIFDPFVQAESAHTRTREGAGLGLTISRRLARLMHGDLTVRSALAKGSTFTLWLRAAGPRPHPTRETHALNHDGVHSVAGFANAGGLLQREVGDIMDAFVERLRTEPIVESAGELPAADLSDHVGTFVANVAGLLTVIESGRARSATLLPDAAHIQSTIADRHGAQRAELGWSAAALRREWTILCEEIEAALRRHAPALPESTIPEVFAVIERLIEQAMETSWAALQRARSR